MTAWSGLRANDATTGGVTLGTIRPLAARPFHFRFVNVHAAHGAADFGCVCDWHQEESVDAAGGRAGAVLSGPESRDAGIMKHNLAMLRTYAAGLIRSWGKQKIFCVGLNKTGTVSLTSALEELGVMVAPQKPAEQTIRDWARRDFRRLIRFCRYFQAFQDVPFSCSFTYQALDLAFPGSKFILTVRQSSEIWRRSLTRYHSKLFAGGAVPQVADLKAAQYCYPGFILDFYRAVFPMDGPTLYAPEMLRAYYESHNASVIEYFRHRPADLLVLDVSKERAFSDLCRFLGKPVLDKPFPWANKTDDLVVPGAPLRTASLPPHDYVSGEFDRPGIE